jgi:hypothetical protein
VLGLVLPRPALLLKSVLVKPVLLRTLPLKFLPLKTRFWRFMPGWVLRGGVLSLSAGPLISRGRDYPGALRRGGTILLSQAFRGGRFLTGGPVRLVPGRDG